MKERMEGGGKMRKKDNEEKVKGRKGVEEGLSREGKGGMQVGKEGRKSG